MLPSWCKLHDNSAHACLTNCSHCLILLAAVKLVLVEECIVDELVPRVVEGVKRMSVGM